MPFQARKPILFRLVIYCSVILTKNSFGALGELSQFQQELSQLNSSSPVEPSGARSPGRICLSTGIEMVSLHQDHASNLHIFPQEGKISKNFITWNQGLFYPFSYGVSFAKVTSSLNNQEKDLNQLSIDLKWTVFESFGLPAISSSIQWSKTYGLKKYALQSNTANIQVSWGYQRLSFFSGINVHQHMLKTKENYQIDSAETTNDPSDENFINFSTQLGAHLQLIPARLALSIESARTSFSNLIRAKVSYEF
ncbi:MAG: hypothetical protein AB8G05_21590 [Oligoflexales bacterium]